MNNSKKRKEKPMSSVAPMYIYATENMKGYYSKLNLKNKRVLSICGSGDQVLNAYFYNAKKVIGFDLNKRAEFITRLKIAAIKEMDYKEFLYFFGRRVNTGFDYAVYKKFKEKLDNKTRRFFDRLYKEFNYNGKKMVKSSYFRQRDDFESPLKLINAYLKSRRNYLKMRKILEKKSFKFISENIKDIHKKLKEKVDIINLSNVPNYYVGSLEKKGVEKPVENFYNVLLNLRKILRRRGKIFFYSYSKKIYPNKTALRVPLMAKESSIRKLKKNFKVRCINFRSLSPGIRDRVVVLE